MKDHAHQFALERMCRIFGVSCSGYYTWLRRLPSNRKKENEVFKSIYKDSFKRYDSPKICQQLRKEGMEVS